MTTASRNIETPWPNPDGDLRTLRIERRQCIAAVRGHAAIESYGLWRPARTSRYRPQLPPILLEPARMPCLSWGSTTIATETLYSVIDIPRIKRRRVARPCSLLLEECSVEERPLLPPVLKPPPAAATRASPPPASYGSASCGTSTIPARSWSGARALHLGAEGQFFRGLRPIRGSFAQPDNTRSSSALGIGCSVRATEA